MTNASKTDPRYLSIREVARQLGVSATTIRREVRLGRIKAVRPSSHTTRIPLSEVERVLRPVQVKAGRQ